MDESRFYPVFDAEGYVVMRSKTEQCHGMQRMKFEVKCPCGKVEVLVVGALNLDEISESYPELAEHRDWRLTETIKKFLADHTAQDIERGALPADWKPT